MKKTLYALVYMSLILLHVQCSKDKDDEQIQPEIDISTTNISVGQSEDATVSFTANVPWTISLSDTRATPNLIDVYPKSGVAGKATVTVSASSNNTIDARTAYVKIAAGTASQTITVTQPGASETLSISQSSQEMPASGGAFTLKI